jgi:hypothetical protein
MKASLLAGAFSGVAGLIVFLVIHHFWIMPIWFILPIGLLIAALGGVAVGKAYQELLPRLPRRPWRAVSMVGLIITILLPSIVLAEMRAPMFDISGPSALLVISVRQAAVIFILELLLTATLVGGIAGWIICHTRKAALSTALAGLIFALGPGHNIPFLGNTPGTLKGVAMLFAIVIVSAVVLVETHARISEEFQYGKVVTDEVNNGVELG